jgi:hypothetical protein
MEAAAAPTAASSATAAAAPPAATTSSATTAASTAAAQERSRPETAQPGRATWCSRAETAASTPHPRPCRTERERKRERRETRTLNGECGVVEGPSGVPTGTTKAKVRWPPRCAATSDSKPDPDAHIARDRDAIEAARFHLPGPVANAPHTKNAPHTAGDGLATGRG